jgi:S1-C subfamily serine protease
MRRNGLLVPFMLVTMLTLMACSIMPLTSMVSKSIGAAIQSALPTSTLAAPAAIPAAVQEASATPASVVPTLAGSTATDSATATATPKPAVVKPAANSSQPQASSPSGDLSSYQDALEAIYQKVNPSVVSIQVVEQAAAGTSNGGGNSPSGQAMALGSGFIWDTQGHIVTNNHVVSGASKISVIFYDGATVDATLVGADPNADLAVIKVNAPANLLVPVQVGDSTQVKVGELVIAIGNPFGLANTMTHGIVSALSRSLPTGLDSQSAQAVPTYSIPDIIQTDTPINPGNSGGVLVDLNGQVIGVTAAIESSTQSNSGIGFVIPSEIVNKVVDPIVKTGKFNHPWLGVTITSISPDIAKAMALDPSQKGALVVSIVPGGPAAKANLLGGSKQITVNGSIIVVGGDIITKINDHLITSNSDLISYVFIHTNSGDTVPLTILRQGKEMTVQITVGVFPAQ